MIHYWQWRAKENLKKVHFASAKFAANSANPENDEKNEVHFASAKFAANSANPENDEKSEVHFASAKFAANLQFWFTYHIENSPPVCENCKTVLYYPSKDIAYSCQAHILPKKLFPSVKSHILNHLTLGGYYQSCKCHGQYDSSWLNASKMPVFELAYQKFLLFKDEISQSELKKIPKLFKINQLNAT